MPTFTHSHRVARNVRAEMVRASMNQKDIAGRLGISQQSLSRRLSGRKSFTIDELAVISETLNVQLVDLVAA